MKRYTVIWEVSLMGTKYVNSIPFASVKSAMDFAVLLILNHFNPIVVKVNGNVISKVL